MGPERLRGLTPTPGADQGDERSTPSTPSGAAQHSRRAHQLGARLLMRLYHRLALRLRCFARRKRRLLQTPRTWCPTWRPAFRAVRDPCTSRTSGSTVALKCDDLQRCAERRGRTSRGSRRRLAMAPGGSSPPKRAAIPIPPKRGGKSAGTARNPWSARHGRGALDLLEDGCRSQRRCESSLRARRPRTCPRIDRSSRR